MSDQPSAIVVGAGVFGAGIADALSSRGWDLTLVERYAPANSRSSSGDASRMLRYGHGASRIDRWYSESAWRARPMWHQLAEEEGRPLTAATGAVWFVTREDPWEEGAIEANIRALGPNGPRCERLAPEQLGELFPDLGSDDLAYGVYEPDAEVLRAADCVRALVRRAQRNGARLVTGTAIPAGDGVLIDGERFDADRVVWACGAWLGAIFPGVVPVTAHRQLVLYWQTDPRWQTGPGWIDAQTEVYGMPDVDGFGMKAQNDQTGPEVDPDEAFLPSPDDAALLRTRDYLGRRFPSLADAEVLRSHTMHYEMSPDDNFRIDRLPGADRTWVVGGGSGHGFKHGPALGAYVADLLEGDGESEPEFRLAEPAP